MRHTTGWHPTSPAGDEKLRDGAEAIKVAKRVCELTADKDATLAAAAYAVAGAAIP